MTISKTIKDLTLKHIAEFENKYGEQFNHIKEQWLESLRKREERGGE